MIQFENFLIFSYHSVLGSAFPFIIFFYNMELVDAALSWYLWLGQLILDAADVHAFFLIFLLLFLFFLFSSILSVIYYFLYFFLILSGVVLFCFILLGGRFDISLDGQEEM